VRPFKIGGLLPSQNVSMATKFSAMSFPNSFKTSSKMYFYDDVSLGFDDCATKHTA